MTLIYTKNKHNIYKWRVNHIDKHRENQRYYQTRYYNWIKVKKEFLNILLD